MNVQDIHASESFGPCCGLLETWVCFSFLLRQCSENFKEALVGIFVGLHDSVSRSSDLYLKFVSFLPLHLPQDRTTFSGEIYTEVYRKIGYVDNHISSFVS